MGAGQNAGFVKIHRRIDESSLWGLTPGHLKVALACLIKANWRPSKWRGVELQRGEFITSGDSLADYCGLTRSAVRRALDNLVRMDFITKRASRSSAYTVISVTNYCRYQDDDDEADQQPTSDRPVTDQQPTSDRPQLKKNKKKKKKKPDVPTPSGHGPSEQANRLTDYLRGQILRVKPDHALGRKAWSNGEPTRRSWAKTFDLMHRRDGRDWRRSAELISYVFNGQTGKDYRFVIESADALRKKWDRIDSELRRTEGAIHDAGERRTL